MKIRVLFRLLFLLTATLDDDVLKKSQSCQKPLYYNKFYK